MSRMMSIGRRIDKVATDDSEHYIRCSECNGWIDLRNLGKVFAHEGPLPHPAEDQLQ